MFRLGFVFIIILAALWLIFSLTTSAKAEGPTGPVNISFRLEDRTLTVTFATLGSPIQCSNVDSLEPQLSGFDAWYSKTGGREDYSSTIYQCEGWSDGCKKFIKGAYLTPLPTATLMLSLNEDNVDPALSTWETDSGNSQFILSLHLITDASEPATLTADDYEIIRLAYTTPQDIINTLVKLKYIAAGEDMCFALSGSTSPDTAGTKFDDSALEAPKLTKPTYGTLLTPKSTNWQLLVLNVSKLTASGVDIDSLCEVINSLDSSFKPETVTLRFHTCMATKGELENLGIQTQSFLQSHISEEPNLKVIGTGASDFSGNVLANEFDSIGDLFRAGLSLDAFINLVQSSSNASFDLCGEATGLEGMANQRFAGQSYPYLAGLPSYQAGSLQPASVGYLQIGSAISFFARPLDKDCITWEVSMDTEFRSLTGETIPVGFGVNAPELSGINANGSMIMTKGKPYVLFDLSQDIDRKTVSKVPLLADIPLIGSIFKNKNISHETFYVCLICTIECEPKE